MSFIPYRNGLTSIIKALKTIIRLAGVYRSIWGGFLSAGDLALLDDLISCANAVIAALEKSEYRPS